MVEIPRPRPRPLFLARYPTFLQMEPQSSITLLTLTLHLSPLSMAKFDVATIGSINYQLVGWLLLQQ